VDAAFSLLAVTLRRLEVEILSEEQVVAAFPAGAGDRDRIGAAELTRLADHPRSGSAIKRALDDFFAVPASRSISLRAATLLPALPGLDRVWGGGAAGIAHAPRTTDRRARPAPAFGCRRP
jgi:hypothetical protein